MKTTILRKKQKVQMVVIAMLIKLSLISACLLFSSLSTASECIELFYTQAGSESVRPYKAYYVDTGMTADNCSFEVVVPNDEYEKLKFYEQQFGEVSPVTTESVSESFLWGFGTYAIFWFIGFKAKAGREVVRRI